MCQKILTTVTTRGTIKMKYGIGVVLKSMNIEKNVAVVLVIAQRPQALNQDTLEAVGLQQTPITQMVMVTISQLIDTTSVSKRLCIRIR